jgi:hypothetical protein
MMKPANPLARIALTATLALFGAAALAQQGPAELPPASFTGAQYVDSTGCVFIRAGVDNAVRWVPRVSRDRQQICGFTPTFTTRSAQPPQPQAQAAAPVIIGGTAATARTATPAKPTPKPARQAAPAPSLEPTVVPVGVVVTAADAASKGVGQNVRVVPKHVYENRRNTTNVSVPKGYRKVWQDDRLNPRRAEQTLAGHAKFRQLWSRTVPQRVLK